MSENIENLASKVVDGVKGFFGIHSPSALFRIKEIDDIKAEIEEKRIRCEFDKVDRLGVSLRIAKDKLVDAVREEYKK